MRAATWPIAMSFDDPLAEHLDAAITCNTEVEHS